jgi:hypothetical protein
MKFHNYVLFLKNFNMLVLFAAYPFVMTEQEGESKIRNERSNHEFYLYKGGQRIFIFRIYKNEAIVLHEIQKIFHTSCPYPEFKSLYG